MRFKKGSKVEVLIEKDVPSGSWRCGEIIFGNGHYYTVKCEGNDGIYTEEKFERVPRKSIRPCPPLVQVPENWLPGDVVEVFHNLSWKMATVLEVLGKDYLLVRLLGSSIEIRASRYDIRVRLCWQDDEWIVIGKGSSKHEGWRLNLPSSLQCNRNFQEMITPGTRLVKNEHFTPRKINNLEESRALPSKALKRRSLCCHSHIEADERSYKKHRVQKENRLFQINAKVQPPLPEKVVAVASSREMLAENCMHPSYNNQKRGCYGTILGREKIDGACAINLESSDGASLSSSVGSCTVFGYYPYRSHPIFPASLLEDNDSQSSDAESVFRVGMEEGNCLPPQEGLTKEVHRLELHAYHCIIEALHASGPLSWEQELLLTNLRDSLHISNDEHLMEGHSRGLVHLASKCGCYILPFGFEAILEP